MYKLKIVRKVYERLKESLEEFRPNIKIELINCDIMLEKLGFCESAPCIVYVDLEEKEMGVLLDDLYQLEIDAFNGNQEPEDDDPLYVLYKKFGWIYDVFIEAEKIESYKCE